MPSRVIASSGSRRTLPAMTHAPVGHKDRPITSPSRASVEKSGYDRPARIEYTVARDTPACSATALSDLPSASRAEPSRLDTSCAARAAVGASEAKVPAGKSPESSQEHGGGAFFLATAPSLPHEGPAGESATLDLTNVRIILHTSEVSAPSLPTANTSAARSAAALNELRTTVVPARRHVRFATTSPVPSKGQRRQAYLTLEFLPLTLDQADRLGSLRGVLASGPRKLRRADYTPVQANLVDVLARLSPDTRCRPDLLAEARARMSEFDQLLQPANGAPQVLVSVSGHAFFVETHPSRKKGGAVDSWIAERLVADCAVGQYVPGFAGVLVFSVRANEVIHVTEPHKRHTVGECSVCVRAVPA